MAYKDVKAFINKLEEAGELIRIKEELDPKYEISAIFKHLGSKEGPAAVIEKVKGYNIPVAGNLFASRKKLAIALETEENLLSNEIEKRMKKPIPPKVVKEAPVRDVIIKDNIDILKVMPVLTYHQRDVSPYLTQAVTFVKDPETGAVNMGVKRTQVKSSNKLGTYPSPGTTADKIFKKADRMNKPLEVAIAVGVDPAIVIAGITITPPGVEKIGIAGSLRGEGVEVVKAETVDLEVPANAMFVLEGVAYPNVRELDGPFGESSGYYISGMNPVIEIKAVTHQRNPILTFFKPYTPAEDTILVVNFLYEAQFKMLKAFIPSLHDVFSFTYQGPYIMSIKKKSDAAARQRW